MNIAFSLSSYPFGKLADKLNPMKLLALGMVLLVLANLLFAYAANYRILAAGIVLFGMHLGATQGIFSTIISEIAPSEVRATAFGIFNFFSGIALLASGLVAGSLWEYMGAQYCFGGRRRVCLDHTLSNSPIQTTPAFLARASVAQI